MSLVSHGGSSLARSSPPSTVGAVINALSWLKQNAGTPLREQIEEINSELGDSFISTAPETVQPTRLSQHGSRVMKSGSNRGRSKGGRNQDLKISPPTVSKVPRGIPKTLGNQIVFARFHNNGSFVASTSAITETNFSFTLATLDNYTSWTTLFDDFCIVQADVEFLSGFPPGNNSFLSMFCTAIDFDNVAALSSYTVLGDYSTSIETIMTPGKRITRSCRPCVKLSASGSTNQAPTRAWLDCALATAAVHYGIRSIAGVAGAGYTIQWVQTVWVAFRLGV